MPYLVVDDEQAKLITESKEALAVRDSRGRHLGFVTHSILGVTEEEIQNALRVRASDQPRYTTKEVLEYLHSLESPQ